MSDCLVILAATQYFGRHLCAALLPKLWQGGCYTRLLDMHAFIQFERSKVQSDILRRGLDLNRYWLHTWNWGKTLSEDIYIHFFPQTKLN